MASSSSTSTSRSVRRSNIEIDYDGSTKYCKCRKRGLRVKAPRWTSWTDKNPGRRFYGCPNYDDEVNNCGYFKWHDPDVSERIKELLNELKLENKFLLVENRQLKAKKRGLYVEDEGDLENEIEEVWVEVRRLNEGNLLEIKVLKQKMKAGYILAFVSWIVMLVVLVLF